MPSARRLGPPNRWWNRARGGAARALVDGATSRPDRRRSVRIPSAASRRGECLPREGYARGVRASLLPLLPIPFLVAACGQCGPTTQSTVDVPVTLPALQALHHPPDLVVEVSRKERHAGGGGCGHSALCVLLVPILVYDRVFPEKWDEATLTDNGKAVYEGRFGTDGELIEARSRKDGFVRLITVLPLEKLKRRVVVEAARAPISADGKDGAWVKTPLVPQIDLPADYRRALATEKDSDDRAGLLIEAATWLGDDALPLLREVLPGEDDESASLVVKGLCRRPEEEQGRALRAEVMGHVAGRPGLKTAEEGLSCAVLSHDPAAARPFAEALGAMICEAKTGSAAKEAARALWRVSRLAAESKAGSELGAVDAAAATKLPLCERAERRVLLSMMTKQPVGLADLELGLSDDELGDEIVSHVDAEKVESRAAIFGALPRRRFDSDLLGALEHAQWSPDAQEATKLAAIYPRSGTSLNGAGRDRSLLVLFGRTRGDPARAAGARRSLEAAVAEAPPGDRPRLRAALLSLGDETQALPASRGLVGMTRLPGRSDQEAITFALRLAGCDDEAILKAARNAATVKDEDRGALCAR